MLEMAELSHCSDWVMEWTIEKLGFDFQLGQKFSVLQNGYTRSVSHPASY
jgi:hypothetical protein